MTDAVPAFEIPEIADPAAVPTGDMPGDSIQIGPGHVAKAEAIFPRLWELLAPFDVTGTGRAVVAVHGGSGVGKSEIGSLLAEYLRANGVGAYVMSGDNYPRRIPRDNDAERLRTYRAGALRGLVDADLYDETVRDELPALLEAGTDSDARKVAEHPWLEVYQQAGRKALAGYLGTPLETNFAEVNAILADFHGGADALMLKRMGREAGQVWYDSVDVRDTRVLVIEWTHGNNVNVEGVDVAILLNSTPEETLAHRRKRARDGGVDSPFTSVVLEIEQGLLHSQAHRAKIIVNKSGELIDYDTYLRSMGKHLPEAGAMLNVYPDSIGGTLSDLVEFVNDPQVAGAFTSAYLLPSVFNTDLDRGFSVIDYSLSDWYASPQDLDDLADAGISLKLDFILNHASVLSPQFQDLLAKGERSAFKDFFIDWNAFWAGHGEMTDEGYVQPDPELIKDMFFRKPGLPILMVRMPDGTEKPYWNTFYQEVRYTVPDALDLISAAGLQYTSAQVLAGRIQAALDEGTRPADIDFSGFEAVRDVVVDWLDSRRKYLGQMDLNITSPLVWAFYEDTLSTLAGYGAEIVRLDAFAYAPKEPGARNFFNEPGTWDVLESVRQLAAQRGLKILPEIHSRYEERTHEQISDRGLLTYDFFLPGLLIDAFERRDASTLVVWINDLLDKQIRTVNMLGCHDGIPLLDLKGLLTEERIDALIEVVKSRGGYVKDLHGQKAMYYQVNATYYSALGESDEALLLARAIQLFMPGKPQIWYLDLFAGRNDHDAVARAGAGGHKEINRTNLSLEDVRSGLSRPVVQRQLELLRWRNTFGAFGFDGDCEVAHDAAERLRITWRKGGHEAVLDADLAALSFTITADGEPV
jgi:glycosidase